MPIALIQPVLNPLLKTYIHAIKAIATAGNGDTDYLCPKMLVEQYPYSVCFLAANADPEPIIPLTVTSDVAMVKVNIAAIIVLLVTITNNGNSNVPNDYGSE